MREGRTSNWVTGQGTLHHLAEDGGILEGKGEGRGREGRGGEERGGGGRGKKWRSEGEEVERGGKGGRK